MNDISGSLSPDGASDAAIEIAQGVRGEPLPVIRDVMAMAERLDAEWRLCATGKRSCCVLICRPDPVVGLPAALAAGEMAERYAANLRGYDAVFRHGRDKLLVCLPRIKPSDVRHVMMRLRERVTEAPVRLANDVLIRVAVSQGGAMMDRSVSVQVTIDRAESALAASRVAGPNGYCVWTPELHS